MSPQGGWHEPLADISVEGAEIGRKVGVFGRYKSLKIGFDRPLKGRRVWAQDLASDVAIDVTSRVAIDKSTLRMEGSFIDRIGLSHATQEDSSDPGLVLLVS
jgi:hypothetical protein